MDWIQQWQSKLNKQNGVAPLVRTGGSRHTGLAALPYRNIQSESMNLQQYKTSTQHSILHSVPLTHIRKNVLSGKKHTERKLLQSSKPYTTK